MRVLDVARSYSLRTVLCAHSLYTRIDSVCLSENNSSIQSPSTHQFTAAATTTRHGKRTDSSILLSPAPSSRHRITRYINCERFNYDLFWKVKDRVKKQKCYVIFTTRRQKCDLATATRVRVCVCGKKSFFHSRDDLNDLISLLYRLHSSSKCTTVTAVAAFALCTVHLPSSTLVSSFFCIITSSEYVLYACTLCSGDAFNIMCILLRTALGIAVCH